METPQLGETSERFWHFHEVVFQTWSIFDAIIEMQIHGKMFDSFNPPHSGVLWEEIFKRIWFMHFGIN